MKKVFLLTVLVFTFIKLAFCQGGAFTVEVVQKEIPTITLPKEHFTVQMRVVNTSGREQTMYIWSCTNIGNWRTDNPLIVPFDDSICFHNEFLPKLLKPGEKFEQEVRFKITKQASPREIKFRAGYRVAENYEDYKTKKGEVYWSSSVTVRVQASSPAPK